MLAVGLPRDSCWYESRDSPMADVVNCTMQYSRGYEFEGSCGSSKARTLHGHSVGHGTHTRHAWTRSTAFPDTVNTWTHQGHALDTLRTRPLRADNGVSYFDMSLLELHSNILYMRLLTLMADNNGYTIVQPQRQTKIPDDNFTGFFFYCHISFYGLQMILAAIVFIIFFFNENFFPPLPMVYICFLANMFSLNKHLHNVREHHLEVAQRWKFAGSLIVLISGSAYPLCFQANTLPRSWMIFAWVVFGIHFPVTVLLNWGLRKIWYFRFQKVVDAHASEILGPFYYPGA